MDLSFLVSSFNENRSMVTILFNLHKMYRFTSWSLIRTDTKRRVSDCHLCSPEHDSPEVGFSRLGPHARSPLQSEGPALLKERMLWRQMTTVSMATSQVTTTSQAYQNLEHLNKVLRAGTKEQCTSMQLRCNGLLYSDCSACMRTECKTTIR